MPDTATQIREYYKAITLRVDPDEILEDSIEPVVTPALRWQWLRGPIMATGAAILVLLLIGGVAWLVGSDGENVIDDPVPVTNLQPPDPTTPAPTPSSPTTTPATSEAAVLWTQVSTSGFSDDAVFLDDVVYGRGVYVAVGWVGLAPNQDAAVWVSEDGIDWTRVSDPAGHLGGDGPQEIRAVVFGDDRFVAVGEDWLAAVGPDDVPLDAPDLAVWVSQDGSSWIRVADDDGILSGPGGQSLWNAYDVVYGDAGYVFLGSERLPTPSLVSWASADGITWSRETLCSENSCSQEGLTELGDVGFDEVVIQALTYGNGTYLAVGGLQPNAPLILLSDDGLQWRVPDSLVGLGAGVFDVTYSGGLFVAAGSSGGSGAIWTSENGISWDLVVEDVAQPLLGIVTSDSDWIIVMPTQVSNKDSAIYWHSRDGIVWTRSRFDTGVSPDAGELFLKSATTANGQHVVIGGYITRGTDELETYIIWNGQNG